MAPPRWRGPLNALVQCGTITGIVVASAINIGTINLYWGWRISLGLAAVPGTILLLGGRGCGPKACMFYIILTFACSSLQCAVQSGDAYKWQVCGSS